MPSAIKFTIGADSSQFAREMRKIEGQSVVASAAHAKARRAIHEREVVEYQSREARKVKGAEEYAAKMRSEWRKKTDEMRAGPTVSGMTGTGGYMGPGRARGFGGASSAMFVSVARDTAASLASGANPITVLMQQMPQVLQAFTMMGKSLASLLPIIAAVATALMAAFATHVISKGIAAMVYGLDKINAEGKRLETTRQVLRNMVQQLHDARDAAIEFAEALAQAKIDNANASAGYNRSLVAEYKARLEAEDIAAKKRGESGRGKPAIESMVKNFELEMAKKDLEAAKNAPPSSKTARLQKELEDINALPLDKRTETTYNRQAQLTEEIALSQETDAFNREAQIKAAETAVKVIENEIAKGPEAIKPTQKPENKLPITEQQRVGAYIGGPQFTMIDLQRKHLAVAQQQLALIKAMKGGKRGVNFGGTS